MYFTICTLAQLAVLEVQRFSSRWLQLVATPVKYNHNSIEITSTLSYRVTVVLIASKLDVGLSHMVAEVDGSGSRFRYLLLITPLKVFLRI